MTRFGQGLVVGKFAPLHAGHQLLVETALAECSRVTVLVYSNPDFPDMPSPVRAGWIRSIYPRLSVHVPTDPPPNDADDWTHRDFVRRWLLAREIAIDAVFTSEAYGEGFAQVLGVPHRLLDLDRTRVPISGTAIRNDPAAHRDFIHPVVRQHFGL